MCSFGILVEGCTRHVIKITFISILSGDNAARVYIRASMNTFWDSSSFSEVMVFLLQACVIGQCLVFFY